MNKRKDTKFFVKISMTVSDKFKHDKIIALNSGNPQN